MPLAGDLPYGVRLIVAYDGTEFAGWQRQPGRRTVEDALSAAVDTVTEHHGRVRGASRTDAGVHALAQVAAFACDRELPAEAWVHQLNVSLPDDVSVRRAEPCAPDFEPRRAAISKLYRYAMRVGRTRDPLTRTSAWQIGPALARPGAPLPEPFPVVEDYLDVEAMASAAAFLVGTHDFRAFQSSDDYRENTIRTLTAVRILPRLEGRDDMLAIEVEGNAFLKNMVRILAGTLLDVGRDRLQPEQVRALLAPTAHRRAAGPTAPAHGLTLVRVALG